MTSTRTSMKSGEQISYQEDFTIDLMKNKNARYKSEVWNHFGKLKNGKGIIITPNRFYCECCLMNKKLKFYSSSIGTGNLSCHLSQVHGILTKSIKLERKQSYESKYQTALRKYYDNVTAGAEAVAADENYDEEHLNDSEYMEYNEEDVEQETEEYETHPNEYEVETKYEARVQPAQIAIAPQPTDTRTATKNYDEMFCLSLVPDLSRLKECQKIKVKIEFMKILEDAFNKQNNN